MAVRRFAPGWLPTVFTLVGVVVLTALGVWQLQRLAWKRQLIAHAETGLAAPPVTLEERPAELEGLDWRRVRVRGRLLAEYDFALGAVRRNGEVGARLITPLVLVDGTVILVDRGFLPEDVLPPREPAALRAEVEAEIIGVARIRARERAGPFTPANDLGGRRWYWLDPVGLRHWIGREVAPVLVIAERAEPPAVLAATEPVRVDLPNRHLGYAITWFGLAAGLLAVYFAWGLSRGSS